MIEQGTNDTLLESMVDYLVDNCNSSDVIISDEVIGQPLKIKRFVVNTNKKFFTVLHHNVLSPKMRANICRWSKIISSSEVLQERLEKVDIKTTFLPPITVDKVERKTYQNLDNFCTVGVSDVKRVTELIDYFGQQLPDKTLTVYGNETIYKQYDNVVYAGILDQVPYEKHQAYISNSESECFANSAIEASTHGLVLFLSKVDLAHNYYAKMDSNIEAFEKLSELEFKDYYHSSTIAEHYLTEKHLTAYQRILGGTYAN
ncbi:hypothetical protein [Streptococcus sp. sy010]|uniref:hypothetical protein n=1 Tax=Streptococcus sp. sy010 TaxID=2600148 RepID=UPI0011B55FC4|nr:hypothetical protein [Streptococcus sp. sy010]TWT14680.1 hypothetical protein FRX51_03670 [Streptococcus sp. sy010]